MTVITHPSPSQGRVSARAELTARQAHQLRTLLRHDPRLRRIWMRHVRRHRSQDIHQAAVAHVLAVYLWDIGEVSERDQQLPRRLKDCVARALTGRCLGPRVLQLFIDAFGMDDATVALLLDPPPVRRPETAPRPSSAAHAA